MPGKARKTVAKKTAAFPRTHSFDDVVVRMLRDDPDFEAVYLKSALEDSLDQREMLIALRRLAKARGIANIARQTGIGRESLYRALSEKGNPTFQTMAAVAQALGLRLAIFRAAA